MGVPTPEPVVNLLPVLAAAAAAEAIPIHIASRHRHNRREAGGCRDDDVAMEGSGGGNGSGGRSASAAPPWDLGMHWAPAGSSPPYPQQPFVARQGGGAASHHQHQQQELTCLKLGKRPCCWAGAVGTPAAQAGAALPPQVHGNGAAAGGASGTAAEGRRKEKAGAATAAAGAPRCQVEGCHAELAGAKDYHRRHKVCAAHSKAPRVVVLGAEQRFCQQCSRSVRPLHIRARALVLYTSNFGF